MDQELKASDSDAVATGDRRLERRRAMIEAAESLFLEQGFDATSLAAIVRKSGGSLATLYELFGNKQGLLRAIIELRKDEDLCPACDGCATKSPADMLREYAHQLYNHVTSPRAIALKRMAITEAIRDPSFARGIYEEIHLPSVRELAAIFERLNREGHAVIDDPMAAADLFFAIIMSDAQLQIMTAGEKASLDTAAIDWRLALFISHFRIAD